MLSDSAPWRYAICNELFVHGSLDETCSYIHRLGYEGVELAPFTLAERITDLTPEDVRRVRRQVETQGLSVVGFHWLLANTEGLSLNDRDPAVREQTVQYLLAEIDVCAGLGGDVLVLGSPQQRNPASGVSETECWEWTADAMHRCGERALSRGVVFCIEALPTYECRFITSVDEAADLVRSVDHPGFRMMVDTKAMSYDERPVSDQIRSVAPLTKHVHVNDPNLGGPGMGSLDFRPILAALREVGYQGWLSVEALDRQTDIETIATTSIAYLKSLV